MNSQSIQQSTSFRDYKLLSINEIRKILKIRQSSVMSLIAEGKLKAIKINNRLKISKHQLDDFLLNSSHSDSRETNQVQITGSTKKDSINMIINKNRSK